MTPVPTICVLGAGSSGLITAYTLKHDGFQVRLITRDPTSGGVWARHRLYKGLRINNVHGEYRFSSMKMPAPKDSVQTGGRLTGDDMCAYMESFADKFLKENIQYETEVLNIRRPEEESGWILLVRSLLSPDAPIETLRFDKLVLCTGGASVPKIPPSLTSEAAKLSRFDGLIFHSSDFPSHIEEVTAKFPKIPDNNSIVIVGGGKSAMDISSYIALHHPDPKAVIIKVVFSTTDAFTASTTPLPEWIRKSRFMAIIAGHSRLRTRLERFLHSTRIGSWLTHWVWNGIAESSYKAMKIPVHSPLRINPGLFWGVRTNDEGVPTPDGFYSLVHDGKIEIVAPARVEGFAGPNSVQLSTGETLDSVGMVVLATGYGSSWAPLLDERTSTKLGIGRHQPTKESLQAVEEWKDRCSIASPPPAHPESEQWNSSVYRGIVPWKNILKRDFAVNGAVISTNNGYMFEATSHWISSYFLEDKFLRLPSTPEDARLEAERNASWLRKRYPDMLVWLNESYSSNIVFWTWPQYVDDLLEDMGLPIMRSGGNWLTWPFRVCDLREIERLGEERRKKREAEA